MKTEQYRVEVHRFGTGPRQIMVWRNGTAGWVFWGSMPIPSDVREDEEPKLCKIVLRKLPERVAADATSRVESMLKAN